MEMETNKRNINLTEGANGNPFRVPEGYFDLLPKRILDKVGVDKGAQKPTFLIRYLKPSLEIAAGFAIVLILIFFPYRVLKKTTSDQVQSNPFDEAYVITYSMDDRNIYETLENDSPETPIDYKQLENLLLGSISEYDLIVLND
jgi:hypothetical protein